MTGRTLEKLEAVLLEQRPDAVLIYGDTNATLAGALAASKLGIRIGHIEAGLRSFIRTGPEEINRTVADHLSDQLFAPTPTAVDNLAREGLAARTLLRRRRDVRLRAALRCAGTPALDDPADARADEGSFVLCTAHRAENTDDPVRLRRLVEQLGRLAGQCPVVFPVHTAHAAADGRGSPGAGHAGPGLRMIDPVGYLDMVRLEQAASVIATDSGGVQREAYFHRKPCVTFRERSEWVDWSSRAGPT